MNKYIISTIALVAFVLASVSCQRDDKHSDEHGLSVSINASKSLDVKDVTLWIYDSNGDMVGSEHTYSSLAEVASDLIDIPAGEYSVAAALNTYGYFTSESGKSLLSMTYGEHGYASLAGESQTMLGTSSVVVGEGSYSICTIDIATPYTTMRGVINDVPEDVTSAKFTICNVSNSIQPLTDEYSCRIQNSVFSVNNAQEDGVYNFPELDFMPAAEGESLYFVVYLEYNSGDASETFYFSCSPSVDSSMQLCPIIPERGKSYLFSLNYSDLSAGYIDLGDEDADTVIVDPWSDADGELEGAFN